MTLPSDWFDRALNDVGSSLAVEGSALGEWIITVEHLANRQPRLTVVGAESIPFLQDSIAWLADHLPTQKPLRCPLPATYSTWSILMGWLPHSEHSYPV